MTDRHAGPIQIKPGEAGRLIVVLPYTPARVAKIKTVAGRRWHPKEQYWTVPHTDGMLASLPGPYAGGCGLDIPLADIRIDRPASPSIPATSALTKARNCQILWVFPVSTQTIEK